MGDISSLIMLPLFFALFYFMFLLPQKKRDKKQREMWSSLKVGDDIVTIGGIIGKVVHIKDDEITIETGVERVKVKIIRTAVHKIQESTVE